MTFTHDKGRFHSIIIGSSNNNIHRLQTKLEYIDNIYLHLQAKHVGHKNSIDAIENSPKTGNKLTCSKFWNDMRISQFDIQSHPIVIYSRD